jgi:aldehyde:ferredoxin oxidoreductase
MTGYNKRLLRVDLTYGHMQDEEVPDRYLEDFIGGKGLGARLLWDLLPRGADPLSPENVVLIVTGPVVGTRIPTSARWAIVTKSPLTGLFLDSYCSENFGPFLRHAGYDVVVFTGRAPEPLILHLGKDGPALVGSRDLWGRGTLATEAHLKQAYPGAVQACIGPAGENGIPFAGVYSEGRWAARGGAGAALGSKGIKAVVIERQQRGPRLHDQSGFLAVVNESLREIRAHPVTKKGGPLMMYGTPNLVMLLNTVGALPSRNWQQNTFAGADGISGETMRDRLNTRVESCFGCPIACAKVSHIPDGRFPGLAVRGPELESIYSLGSQLGIDNIEAVAYLNHLCNDYGLDTISTGVTIGMAMEAFERGLISLSDTEGLELRFGNVEAAVVALGKIVRREGIGDWLAHGTRVLAARLGEGAGSFAMNVKGLELPAYDPRGMKGMGIAYATADRGGCHLRASTLNIELRGLGEKVDRFAEPGKARIVKEIQDAWSIIDSMLYCKFGGYAITLPVIARAYSAATGRDVSSEDLRMIGERIYNITRLVNLREGMSPAEDDLPRRLLDETVAEGPSVGQTVDLKTMLEEYYTVRGWPGGIPGQERLAALGLDALARVESHTPA